MHKRNQISGFTIVELLIVIVVIAILAAISIVAYTGIQTRARNSIVEQNLSNTVKALEMYNAEFGNYPYTSTDAAKVKSNGLVLTSTQGNILLYCVDTASPNAWLILANGFPSTVYRWTSGGERNSNSGASMGSGTTTCQSQLGVSTAIGHWSSSLATIQ